MISDPAVLIIRVVCTSAWKVIRIWSGFTLYHSKWLILKKDGHCVIQSVVKTNFIVPRSHPFHCTCVEFDRFKNINRESNIYPFATCLRHRIYDYNRSFTQKTPSFFFSPLHLADASRSCISYVLFPAKRHVPQATWPKNTYYGMRWALLDLF